MKFSLDYQKKLPVRPRRARRLRRISSAEVVRSARGRRVGGPSIGGSSCVLPLILAEEVS